jgi:hypothetical protein
MRVDDLVIVSWPGECVTHPVIDQRTESGAGRV